MLFKNAELNSRIKQYGFVKTPFLNSSQIAEIKILAEEFPLDRSFDFYSSSYHIDLALKKDFDAKLRKIVLQDLENNFENFSILGSAFLYKQAGSNSVMPPHQDWTVVDEKKHASITLWIPLQDVNAENGCLSAIEGSHQFFEYLRSPSIAFPYQDYAAELLPLMKRIEMQAGEAFVFNHALVHASPPNLTNDCRIALAIGIVSKEAELKMYYQIENNSLQEVSMPADMFIRYPEIAKTPLIGVETARFDYLAPSISLQEFRAKAIQFRKENTSMNPLFTSTEHQQFFEENGYIKLPALNENQINQLTEYYHETNIKDERGYGFHVGMDQQNKALVGQMVEKIAEITMPAVSKYFTDIQLFTASFVIKEINPQGVVPPHQDWSFVEDEEKHCSVTCWIPLQDVNMQNGCLGVIKGSNHFFTSVRPSPAPQLPTPLTDHMFTVFPYMQLIEMEAGEMLIFNNKTIHASPPNVSDKTRLAVGLGLTQKDAEVCHYFLKPGTKNRMLKYKVDQSFYMKYDNGMLSKMYDENKQIDDFELVAELPYEYENWSADEWKKHMQEAGNSFNIPLVENLAALFNYNVDGSKKEETSTPTPIEQSKPPIKNEGFVKRIFKKIFA